MRIFVTGGSGFIGKAVITELIGAGHSVLALARSDEAVETVKTLGADVLRGSLQDLDVLKEGAGSSDGIIHLAFIHDFSNFSQSCQVDQAAIKAMASVLAGSNRPLIITSGTMLLPLGRLGTELDSHVTSMPSLAERGQCETLAKDLASEGVRTAIMRLAVVNHGPNDEHMFISNLIHMAQAKGSSVYIGDGLNRWPAVHCLDTASAYRLALEKVTAGSIYHIVAEEGVKMRDIAESIGKNLGLPTQSMSTEEAKGHMGSFAHVVGSDNPVSSKITRDSLGWNPRQCTLLEDLQHGTYFNHQ